LSIDGSVASGSNAGTIVGVADGEVFSSTLAGAGAKGQVTNAYANIDT